MTSEEKTEELQDKCECTVTIENVLGLHVRPIGMLVETANGFESKITVNKDDKSVDAKSIFEVMSLAAEKGSTLNIIAEGTDAEDAVKSLKKLINDKFGEE